MRPITFQQLRQAVSGKPLCVLPDDLVDIEKVCTDTRHMQKRSVFVALRGDTYDAHEHLAKAVAGGAIALVVERLPAGFMPPQNVYVLQVADSYLALGRLARFVRQQLHAKVVAVAGSNGKTSTKLLIDAALSTRLRGYCSPKSFNNRVGVPLTIFPADPGDDYLIVEIGTNHHGEIAPLAEMSQPDIAVITNAGAEHLEGLGDLRGVRRENAAIVNGLNPKGLLVVNGDDPELVAAVSHFTGRCLTFGFAETNDLFATDVRSDATGVRFWLNGNREVQVPLLGRHTALNALAAIAVGRRLGLSEEAIFEGLAQARGPEMRLQLAQVGDLFILNDAYNANPNSMRAALDTLANLDVGARKIAVLGDMRELGQASERYHREIGQLTAAIGLGGLVCVGPMSQWIAEAAVTAGLPAAIVQTFADATSAADAVTQFVVANDLILVKASRGIGLERVATALVGRLTTNPANQMGAA